MANRRLGYGACLLLAAGLAVTASGRSRWLAFLAALSGYWAGTNLMVAGFHALATRGELKMEYKRKP